MPDPTQVSLLAKIFSLLIKLVNYIARIFTDQTKLTLLFPRSATPSENIAWIFEQEPHQSPGVGLFYFGVTTTAKHEVEIIEVALYYAAPLQLKNPGTEPFFETCQSPDVARPFAVRWQGSTVVTKAVTQTFGVEVDFRDGIKARDVVLAIKAQRRVPKVGGFVAKRREQLIRRTVRLNLTSDPPQGLGIPKGVLSQSPQAFMRRALRGIVGAANLVWLNYIDEEGHPRSAIYIVPGPNPPDRGRQPTSTRPIENESIG
ncbi:MAG: hypothetical protein KA191_16030 [Verrucomicrobia bacterium]|jgi:hypothetical protein|nr:hypothetical protein [Verrucomicrobiota bacterium]